MKQESLEEAAEIWINNRFTKQICGDKSYPDIYASKKSIIESHIIFAKWQAERMYSEEEVESIWKFALYSAEQHDKFGAKNKSDFIKEDVKEFIKQFKKK